MNDYFVELAGDADESSHTDVVGNISGNVRTLFLTPTYVRRLSLYLADLKTVVAKTLMALKSHR